MPVVLLTVTADCFCVFVRCFDERLNVQSIKGSPPDPCHVLSPVMRAR